MSKRAFLLALAPVLFAAGTAHAQYPVLDEIAGKVIQRYQQSTCEELWEARSKPKSEREQEAIQLLREDPQMLTAFLAQIATPVATKMFQCGMIP